MDVNTSVNTGPSQVYLILTCCFWQKLVHRTLTDVQSEPEEGDILPSSRDNTSFTLFSVHLNELTVTPPPPLTHTYTSIFVRTIIDVIYYRPLTLHLTITTNLQLTTSQPSNTLFI